MSPKIVDIDTLKNLVTNSFYHKQLVCLCATYYTLDEPIVVKYEIIRGTPL